MLQQLHTFVCFFDVYAGVIFKISKSNRASATRDICFVPVSKIENTDAGCSELCRTCTILGFPVVFYLEEKSENQTYMDP